MVVPSGEGSIGAAAYGRHRRAVMRCMEFSVESSGSMAHDATAGGTMGERRPNEAFAGGV